MRKKVTIVEIAAAAGVSVSTAGRVLNGASGVSLQRRRKVLEAVRELGASRLPVLPEGHSLKVLVIRMGLDDDPYFKRMDMALDQAAESLPSQIELVRLTNLSPFELSERLRNLDFRPHGAIVLAFDTLEVRYALERLGRQKIPIVTLTTDIRLKTPRSFVGIDNEAAGRTAALMISRFVHNRGRVLMITGSQDYEVHRQRTKGFEDALAEYAPHLQLVGPIDVADMNDRALTATRQAFSRQVATVAIYNSGGANEGIRQALEAIDRVSNPIWITHEASPRHVKLLRSGQVALLIDQDPSAQALTGLQLILHAHGEIAAAPRARMPFRLVSAENWSDLPLVD
ncbi:LacI family transcriptional regulator [Pseudomonas sp. S37]|uniref:LacI family DNA-binding transcriptional regulator n=1 Tax=unclassified Pseudomonas TaxID=196821 RepID=UPI0019131F4F|nr:MULTISPECIES: LacI family DNA-binding transcriptional regulator [unclassified Pseudomonas]MBK4987694.1 LacI family transcriptional regulator [Pseudomonas sp. S36]MBK4991859.1 LacI family transcriptional regulator [Pseudomonas sp. S37]